MTISKLASRRYPASSHGGRFASGQPRLIVVHSTESEATAGTAANVARYLQRAGLSVHYVIDPGSIIAGLDEDFIGWGAGTVNSAAIHIEFCGRAAWDAAQWGEVHAEIDLGRKLIADIAARHGIPLRFTTDEQLHQGWRGTGPGGITTHAQCTKVIGGTTHTDPGSGFPLPLLLSAPAKTPKPATPQKELTPLAKAKARLDELVKQTGVSEAAARHYEGAINAACKGDLTVEDKALDALYAFETLYDNDQDSPATNGRAYSRLAAGRVARAVYNVRKAS